MGESDDGRHDVLNDDAGGPELGQKRLVETVRDRFSLALCHRGKPQKFYYNSQVRKENKDEKQRRKDCSCRWCHTEAG